MTPEVIKIGEAAAILGVTTRTVKRWCELGWLPYSLTLGGHRRFRRDEMVAIAAAQRVEASA